MLVEPPPTQPPRPLTIDVYISITIAIVIGLLVTDVLHGEMASLEGIETVSGMIYENLKGMVR